MATEAVSLGPDSLHGSLVVEVVVLELGQHYLRGKLNLGIVIYCFYIARKDDLYTSRPPLERMTASTGASS